MAAPTISDYKKYSCQNGAVHIWPFADERCLTAYEVEAEDDLLESDRPGVPKMAGPDFLFRCSPNASDRWAGMRGKLRSGPTGLAG